MKNNKEILNESIILENMVILQTNAEFKVIKKTIAQIRFYFI